MTTTDEMITAHGTIVAALRVLRRVAERTELDITVRDLLYHAETRIEDMTPRRMYDTEPAEPESIDLRWSEVIPGDSVLAPNGTWYEVDSVARIGTEIRALFKPEGRSAVPAAGQVTVRRGPAGRAADVFRAGGINVEVMAG